MSYAPISTLSDLYKNKMSSQLALAPGVNGGATAPSVGVKTKSPTTNVKIQSNTTPQPVKTTSAGVGSKTTDGGTQATNTIPQYDAQGGFTSGGQYYGPNSIQAQNSKNISTSTSNPTPTPSPSPTPTPTPSPTPYTPTDNGLYGKLVTDLANRSQQGSPDYQRIQDERTALAKDYAQKTNNIAGTAGFLTQQTGLQGQLNNQYNTVQSNLTNELSYANSQEQLKQGALGSAINASAPQFPSYYNPQFNPVTNTYSQTGGGPQEGATKQFEADTTKNYLQGTQNLKYAQTIEDQIANTILSNPDINNQPISLLTNLNQYVSGQLGTAPQQLLAQQVQNYIQALGLDPASVVSIANQQKGTLKQLLASLKQTATSKVESTNPANIKTNNSTTKTTGNTWNDIFGA